MPLRSGFWPRGSVAVPASPQALSRLGALGCPPALLDLYREADGCFTEGLSILPASAVQRHGDKVDVTSVRGVLVFGTGGSTYEQIYCVDVPGFFGKPGAIVRGMVKLKWGWAQHIADDAEQFLKMLGAKAPRGVSIAKTARKTLSRAIAASAKKGLVTVTPPQSMADPDQSARNLRDDGRTQIAWALTHLYSVCDSLEGFGRRVLPFGQLDHTPDAFEPAARGILFAEDAEAQWVVSQGTMSFPEGLVIRVPRAAPSELTVHGHLLDVVTAWAEGRATAGEAHAAWVSRVG